jgi:predicted ribosome quality control (RQC) complex YloA/Tae2 family protein
VTESSLTERAAGVAQLAGARLQKLTLGDDGRALLELFAGERRHVVVDPRPPAPHATATRVELPRGDKPPREQAVLRKELVPSRLTSAELDAPTGLLTLSFERPDAGRRALYLELSAHDPRAVLCGVFEGGERVLCVLGPVRCKDGRDLRRGRAWEAPRAPGPLPAAPAEGAAEAHAQEVAQAHVHKELRVRLKAERKRAGRLVRALERDLDKHGSPEALARDGELLKTVLSRLQRGADRVEVTGWDGEPHVVELDPARSPQQNLESFFVRARRAREAQRRALPRLEEARARVQTIDDARDALTKGEAAADDIEGLLREANAGPSARRRAVREGGRKPWRAFRVHGDAVARVGRSARDNDALTLRAKGNDLWLHARGTAGGHVVVACPPGDPPAALLDDVALLAAWFSPKRREAGVDVQYTRRKHLDKPGKGTPGLFLVRKEKVVRVRVDEERAKALLAREVPA